MSSNKLRFTASLTATALTVALAVTSPAAMAQDAVADFYKGKQVTFYVGFAPGGGYDTYARLLQRHMSKHMPGAPAFLVKNMFGAAGEVAASYVANVAAKDGTAIAGVSASQPLARIFVPKDKRKYDPAKQHYLGSAATDTYVCIARKDAPVKTLEDLLQTELIVGSSAPGAGTLSYMPNMEKNLLGIKLKLIPGYRGSRAIMAAMERGEVQGICGINLSSVRSQFAHFVSDGGLARILVQESIEGDAKLNAAGLPRLYDLAKTDKQRKIMRMIYTQGQVARPYFVAGGVPAERVAALRKAFLETLKDKALLAEAAKLKLDIDPVPGPAIQSIVDDIGQQPESFIDEVKAAIASK